MKKKFKINKSKKSRVYYLPPESNFAVDFVEGLIKKFQVNLNDIQYDLISQIRILTSNRRSASHLQDVFRDFGFIILPKITQLEELTDLFYSEKINGKQDVLERISFPIVSAIEKHLIVDRLILQNKLNENFDIQSRDIIDLVTSIENLIEEITLKNILISDIEKIYNSELSYHGQFTIKLLIEVLKSYFVSLEKYGRIDSNVRYSLASDVLATHWKIKPCLSPILLVGSTGSNYATAKLMRAVSYLPQGFVILPGLDTNLDKKNWSMLGPDHPQYSYRHLFENWYKNSFSEKIIQEVPIWHKGRSSNLKRSLSKRAKIFSNVMLPAKATDSWVNVDSEILNYIEPAFEHIALIEAENIRAEAAAIGAATMKSVSEGSTVAIITPSKIIARSVIIELERWNIFPNSYGFKTLGETDLGIFMRQLVAAKSNNFEMKNLLSLLKNINCGITCSVHYENVIKLDNSCFDDTISFLDFELTEEPNISEDQFFKWYAWLKDLIDEIAREKDWGTIEYHVKLHVKFLELLLFGYSAQFIDESLNCEKKSNFWSSHRGEKIKNIFSELSSISKNFKKFSSLEYRKIFEKIIMDKSIDDEFESLSRSVFIWGTLEARTQAADVFILAGLNEGVWPGNFSDDSWVGRQARSLIGLDFPERKVGLSAHDFQQASMGRKVIFSRSLRDASGLTICSRWLSRLENFLKGLGEKGIEQWNQVRIRGSSYLLMSKELYSSKFLINNLPKSIRLKALRPAPMPPISARPNKLSVTEIEVLLKDPYAIYAKHILGLKKLRSVRENFGPQLRGIIAHAALEMFILKTMKNFPDKEEACQLLKECFCFQLDLHRLSPEKKLMWKMQFYARIDSIVEMETSRRQKGKPYALENFGNYRIPLPNKRLFAITAKADRIDIGSNGFLLYDYKSRLFSQNDLEKFSPQIDIQALILENGGFKGIKKGEIGELSLILIGSNPKQLSKVLKREDLSKWKNAVHQLIKKMRLDLSPFYARLDVERNYQFENDYDHLSRYGEWFETDKFNKEVLKLEQADKISRNNSCPKKNFP